MAHLTSRIEAIESFQESIGKDEIERLAKKMVNDSESEEDLAETVELFFTINASDAVATMDKMRKFNYEKLIQVGEKEQADQLKSNEKEIDKLVKTMHDYSEKEFRMPYHLAAALGKFETVDTLFSNSSIGAQNFVPAASAQKASCPSGDYPRYVNYLAPWRLRNAWSIRTRQRRQDVGCHFEQGPYDGTIKGWFTWSPAIVAVVYMNGWNGKLAANHNHFFYKWWTLAPIGFSFWNMTMLLYARRY